jgi:hypothetical protein
VGDGTAEAVGNGVGVGGGGSVTVGAGIAEAVGEARRAIGAGIVGVAGVCDWQPLTTNTAINPMTPLMRNRRDNLTMGSLCG